MNVLAIDTAANAFSVALSVARDGKEELYAFEAEARSRHSELLVETIDLLLKKARLERQELDGVLCMKGPGSFTGLRIGYAAAKALALALDIKMAAIPTLDCMAFPHSAWPGLVVPVIDAKKSSFYCSAYRGGKALCKAADIGPAAFAGLLKTLNNVDEPFAAGAERQKILFSGPDGGLLVEKLAPYAAEMEKYELVLDPVRRPGYALFMPTIEKNCHLFNNVSKEVFHTGPEYIRKSDAELNLNFGR